VRTAHVSWRQPYPRLPISGAPVAGMANPGKEGSGARIRAAPGTV